MSFWRWHKVRVKMNQQYPSIFRVLVVYFQWNQNHCMWPSVVFFFSFRSGQSGNMIFTQINFSEFYSIYQLLILFERAETKNKIPKTNIQRDSRERPATGDAAEQESSQCTRVSARQTSIRERLHKTPANPHLKIRSENRITMSISLSLSRRRSNDPWLFFEGFHLECTSFFFFVLLLFRFIV